MGGLNNLSKFIIGFILCYIVVSALHLAKPVRNAHVAVFNVFEQVVFNAFHPNLRVNFKKYVYTPDMPPNVDNFDFSIYIYERSAWKKAINKKNLRPRFILNQNSRVVSIAPFSLFLSLLLVSPVGWKRKLASWITGSVVILGFLALKFSYLLEMNSSLKMPTYSIWRLLSVSFGNAFRTTEFLLICVLIVWALVTLRMRDYKWYLK